MSRALTRYLALNRLPNLDLHPTPNLCGERYSMLRPSIEDLPACQVILDPRTVCDREFFDRNTGLHSSGPS